MAMSGQQRDKEKRDATPSTAPAPSPSSLQPTYTPSPSLAAALPSAPALDVFEEKKEAQEKFARQLKHHEIKTEIREQKLKAPPVAAEIDAVITKSTLADRDSAKQADNIKKKFNEGIKEKESCFTTSVAIRGKYLQLDEFMLASRNRKPEIASFIKDMNTATIITVDGTEIQNHGLFKHYDPFFGAHGCYVLNVPPDKLALAKSGQKPLIFGPGPHVIKDPNFLFDPETGFVTQSTSVIQHGVLNVIRVPKGSIAKIRIGSEFYILEYREEPYVFSSPLFHLERQGNEVFFRANEPVIEYGTIRILRVPAGSYAKVWIEGKPLLLWSRSEPYVFDTAQFRLDWNDDKPFFAASDPIIQHGTISIIRVPAGYIALVNHGSEPELLESRAEPYYFDSPNFSIVQTEGEYFVSATEKLIEHGSIKRILPPINHEAIVSDGGNLTIITAKKDGSPTVLTSPSQKFESFIDKSIQTVTFPSEETIQQRIRDKKEHPIYEVFRTKNFVQVGVTILVGFQIRDVKLAIQTLGSMKGVVKHIEHLANADMNRAIQQSSSQDFTTSYQTRPHRDQTSPGSYGQQTPPPPQHYQDIVRIQLANELEKIGIDIIRLNIENPVFLNESIAAKMEEQSMLTTEADAREAVIRQNYNIELAKADREAAIKQVEQDQKNKALKSTAEAKLDAAKLEAEAVRVAAQGEADAIVIKAKAQQDAAALEGEMLSKYPALMQMRMLEIRMTALKQIQFFAPQAGTMPPGMTANPFMLFNQWSGLEVAPGVVAAASVVSAERDRAPSLAPGEGK